MDKNSQTFKFKRAVITELAPVYLEAPFYDATMGPFDRIKLTHWIELYDDDGIISQGGCSEFMEKNILPLVLTGKRETYREIYDRVYWANRNRGFSSETYKDLGKLDFMLHDIMAKRAGLPLHRFLGATRDWVNAYASGHGLNTTLDELVKEAESLKELGYSVYKMKVGTGFGSRKEQDLERVAVMREVIGNAAKLAIDANQVWNSEEALDFAVRAEKYDIAWFEEPVHAYDLAGLEKLIKECPIPVAMGESMKNHYPFSAYVRAGVKHLQYDAGTGFEDWAKVRDLAKENNLMFSSGGAEWITAYMATTDEACMFEFLRPLNAPIYNLMEIRPEERDGKFYLPALAGSPAVIDFKLIERLNYIIRKKYIYPQ